MESLGPEEESIIKDITNLFRLKKKQNCTAVKDIRNLFRLKKEIKGNKDKVLRNIKNLFEYEKEEENYYKPGRVYNFWSNSYIEYKSSSDRNKTLSVEKYLDKIRPYLISNNLTNFISSKDDNDEERGKHSKSDNIEILISDVTDEIIENLFKSLKNR